MKAKQTKEFALEKAQEHANNYGLKPSEFRATLIQFGSECYLKAIEETNHIEVLEALKGLLDDFKYFISEVDKEPDRAGYIQVAEEVIRKAEEELKLKEQ